jgi:DNA uptake protein ComE-like DNA-binding protein
LVSLLWIVAILSIVVVGVLHSANLDLRVVKNHGDSIQAHYLALAGIEKAKALLYQASKENQKSGINHSEELYDSPENFRDVAFSRGTFRVFNGGESGTEGGIKFGVVDENRFLNFNTAQATNLTLLDGMTPEVIAALMDYRDQDQQASPGGAEFDEYAAMQPPYIPHDAPFRTLRELLMVRGMPANLLLGEDSNANNWLDPDENDGELFKPMDNQDGKLDRGWAGLGTLWSTVRNVNARGEARINIQQAGESQLAEIDGISTDLAKSIVQYRGYRKFETVADLLDVRAIEKSSRSSSQSSRNQSRSSSRSRSSSSSSGNQSNGTPTGPNLIDQTLLTQIADFVTASEDTSLPGRINVNTAAFEILNTLPGIDEILATAIINHRSANGFFQSSAGILEVDGMTTDIFKELAEQITTRSETFRIFSEGRIGSTGASRRLQVVVQIGANSVNTLSYREDL